MPADLSDSCERRMFSSFPLQLSSPADVQMYREKHSSFDQGFRKVFATPYFPRKTTPDHRVWPVKHAPAKQLE
jgi:hypothetical protein